MTVQSTDAGSQGTLRRLLVAPLALLLLAIGVDSVRQGRLQDSISAYYGGSLRDIFVGCLFASCVLLVTYHGRSPLEDFALNVAAILAPFVALVPWNVNESVKKLAIADADGKAAATYIADIRWLLCCYVAIVVIAAVWDYRRNPWQPREFGISGWRIIIAGVIYVTLLAFMLTLIYRLVDLTPPFDGVHMFAAFFMIACLALSVLSQVLPAQVRGLTSGGTGTTPGNRAVYGTFCLLMVLGIPGWLLLESQDVKAAVFWVEVWELSLFLIYWIYWIYDLIREPSGATDRTP